MTDHKKWTNEETRLVNLWYGEVLPGYFTDTEQYHADGHEVREAVEYLALERESMFLMREGMLMNFINRAFSKVNWDEIADAINERGGMDANINQRV